MAGKHPVGGLHLQRAGHGVDAGADGGSAAAVQAPADLTPVAPGLARDNPQDRAAGAHHAAQGAADFGLTGQARQIQQGDFTHAQTLLQGLDLHLDGPAVTGIAHLQILQGRPADQTHGAEILVVATPQQADKPGGQAIAEALLQAQGGAVLWHPLGQHQIEILFGQGLCQQLQLGVVVAAIGIGEGDKLWRLALQGRDAGQAGRAIAKPFLAHHPGTASTCQDAGVIGRAVIDYQDLADAGRNAA